ncbi:MAG TPA: hypothetical protein VNO79_11160 [Actinomycetota bacterium]|nr:hypothetical protein [Actinomycetota bacterium]
MAEFSVTPELYFMRRLATVRRAQALSASMQFDLARSPLSDDELEQVVDAFDGKASASGFGFSEILRDVLSREPRRIPVPDLKRLQENLIRQGYAPPDAQANGVWDPNWYAYFRRWDRDNYEAVVAGRHWGAAPIEAGIRAITNTLPSRVWQGLVGTARGLVEQTPETFERGGLLGGAAAGAAIGATVASVVPGLGTAAGAVGGAVIGGVAGFLADLFGKEPEEVEESVGQRLLDALSPYEEYRQQGWRAFWEDLGYVGAATSLIAGAGLAVRGAAGVVAGIRATAAGEVPLAAPGITPGVTPVAAPSVTPGVTPGPVMPALRAALQRPAVPELGPVAQVVRAATRRLVPGSAGWIEQQMIRFGPLANIQRPAFQVVTKAFSGLSAGQMGARLAAGFDLGTGAAGTTTIEKAIEETDPLRSGITLPLLGDLVDWAAFVMVPERFLPFRARDLARAADRLLGDASLLPYAHAFQYGTDLSLRRAADLAKEVVTPELNTYLRLDYGIHVEALSRLRTTGTSGTVGAYTRARAEVVRALKAEVAAEGPGSPLVRRILEHSLSSPTRFEAWLVELGGENRGVAILRNWAEASRIAREVERDVRSGRLLVNETDEAFGLVRFQEGPGRETFVAGARGLERKRGTFRRELVPPRGPFMATPEGLEVAGVRGQGLAEAALRQERTRLEQAIRRNERLARRSTDPAVVARLNEDLRRLRERLEVVRREIAAGPQKVLAGVRVLPARLDFLTRRDLYDLRRRYLELADQVKKTWEGNLTAAHVVAREQLRDLVQDLAAKGYIPDELARRTVAQGAAPGREVARYLEEAAQTAARDVDVPPEVAERLRALGYKPVVTGEDVIALHEIPQIAEVFGVGDYTRRRNFFETLGLSPRWTKDEDLFALRVASERAELQQIFEERGLPLSGQQAITRLRERLTEMNHQGVVVGPVVKPIRGRARLYMVDVRELSPEDILAVFEDIPNFTDDVARDVYAALKRGAAYGADADFLHPMVAARELGRALRINGLPGFSDFIRTLKVPVTRRSVAAAAGALAGAAAGAALGDEPKDILRGAVGGAAVGLLGRAAAARTYGYLPDHLVRLNTALRYTFSLTFDAGRYSEQNLIAAARYGLPPMLRPKRYLTSRGPLRSPYSAELVHGEEAWQHAVRLWDEINGVSWFVHIDDTDRRLFQAGLLGFQPRNFEVAQAFLLYQRGWSQAKIKEAISQIGRYGLGRTALEKSANFIFFPFSFSKKLITSLGDFLLQAPGRNLLLHEGLRRYHESSLDERFHDLIENHLPLLEQLWTVNNLAFGLSPGRFFLEGFDDHRTTVGRVMQILASVLVPSGAATPLAQAAGGLGDLGVHAFVPVVITGESLDRAGGIDGLDDILRRYVPLVREIDQYFVEGQGGKILGGAVGEQIAATLEGRAPYGQLTAYLDEIRAFKHELEPLAIALGYSSVEGFLASDLGAPIQARYEELKQELRRRYPTGFRLVSEIDNSALMNEAALADLVREPDPEPGEQQILRIAEKVTLLRMLNQELGVPADIGGALIGATVRQMALPWAEDRRFAELYDRFFMREFGPIRRIAT